MKLVALVALVVQEILVVYRRRFQIYLKLRVARERSFLVVIRGDLASKFRAAHASQPLRLWILNLSKGIQFVPKWFFGVGF